MYKSRRDWLKLKAINIIIYRNPSSKSRRRRGRGHRGVKIVGVDVVGVVVLRTGVEVVGVKIESIDVAGVVEIVGPANPSQSAASNLDTTALAITKTRMIRKM